MIKKLYDKCVEWAGYRYAKPILAFEAFIESSFFPIPPDVMIIPMVISKKNEFIRIALIATIFSVLGALFGYYIGYSLNEVAIKIFEFYGYEYSHTFKEKFFTNLRKIFIVIKENKKDKKTPIKTNKLKSIFSLNRSFIPKVLAPNRAGIDK